MPTFRGRRSHHQQPCDEQLADPVIRVAIADDQPLVRAGLRAMLDRAADLTVVGEGADGREAVELSRAQRPDVLLMDVRMPVLDGIEATRLITTDPDTSGVRVIILTTFDLDELVYAALRAGAAGFLLKDVPPERLFDAIRVVAAGDALIAPGVTRRLIAEFARSAPLPAASTDLVALLTQREREVLTLVGAGLSNVEVSARLVISEATAKTHVHRLLTKLGARDRAQLVVLAYESGLVRPSGR
jgi:DNA-binding NarL/FixJ family response regulator